MKEFTGIARYEDNSTKTLHVYARNKKQAIETMLNLSYAKGVEII